MNNLFSQFVSISVREKYLSVKTLYAISQTCMANNYLTRAKLYRYKKIKEKYLPIFAEKLHTYLLNYPITMDGRVSISSKFEDCYFVDSTVRITELEYSPNKLYAISHISFICKKLIFFDIDFIIGDAMLMMSINTIEIITIGGEKKYEINTINQFTNQPIVVKTLPEMDESLAPSINITMYDINHSFMDLCANIEKIIVHYKTSNIITTNEGKYVKSRNNKLIDIKNLGFILNEEKTQDLKFAHRLPNLPLRNSFIYDNRKTHAIFRYGTEDDSYLTDEYLNSL